MRETAPIVDVVIEVPRGSFVKRGSNAHVGAPLLPLLRDVQGNAERVARAIGAERMPWMVHGGVCAGASQAA